MKFDEYAVHAASTAVYDRHTEPVVRLAYVALGLNGEAGEVADKIKKAIRDEAGVIGPERREAIAAELGDVLWYVAECARLIGVPLEDVARGNVAKLASRAARGAIGGDGDAR